jgi:hypothetical protein
MPEPQPTWQGWSDHDLEILRHHCRALGLQIQIPESLIKPPNVRGFSRPEPEPKKEQVPVKNISNYTNHIVFVLDASSSMNHLAKKVITVVDNQVAYFAKRSQEMDQETRISIFSFADTVKCLVWDKDVLRMPSISELYQPYGNTALIDGTLQALSDARTIPEQYGDHAHLIYVVTDGQENASGRSRPGANLHRWGPAPELIQELKEKLTHLPENVTVATLVPDQSSVFTAKQYGFPAGNVAVWDATSARGLEEASETMRRTTDSYMQARTTGTRSTTNLFDIGANVVNAQAILDAGLKPLDYSEYDLVPIPPLKGLVKPADYDEKKRRKPWKVHGGRIDEFVQNVRGGQYIAGQAYYQLVEGKTERIQPSKNIAVVNKKTERVYTGPGARDLVGLRKDREERVKPSGSEDYLVYVQSKSPNRLLVVGSKLLIMK